MRVFLRFSESKLAFIFSVHNLFYKDVKMFNDSLAIQVCVLLTTKTSSSLTVVSCNQFILQSAAKAGSSVCVCMFVLASVPVCLCMHLF